jgi:hypothetical protein
MDGALHPASSGCASSESGHLADSFMSLESGNWVRYKAWGTCAGRCENYIREPRPPCRKIFTTRISEDVLKEFFFSTREALFGTFSNKKSRMMFS